MINIIKRFGYLSIALTLALQTSVPAIGAPITYDVSFIANNFQTINVPAPVDPVVGSFTITLDPSLAVTDDTAGITLNSLNIALGSPISYTYNPAPSGPFAAGTLRVGGLSDGADSVTYSPSTNDFWLQITNFATTPAFEQVGYSQTSVSNDNLFYTINQTGSVSVNVVPETSTIVLGFVGLASLAGGYMTRRRKVQD